MQIIDCDRSFAPQILAILNEAIVSSTALYDYRPRTPEMMSAWFDAKERGGFPVIGAVAKDALLGFASYGIFRAWPAFKYTVEHSLYVERESRGRGIGTKLLEEIVARARAQGLHNLVGGIDAENAASVSLHKKHGFEYCGRIRHAGFKFGRWLDLDFYQLLLDTPADPSDG